MRVSSRSGSCTTCRRRRPRGSESTAPMNEAVDRVIEAREAMDRGFPAGIVLSGAFHLLLVGAAFGAAWLGPRRPAIEVVPGFVVPVPRGGGGPVEPDPAPAVAPPVTT